MKIDMPLNKEIKTYIHAFWLKGLLIDMIKLQIYFHFSDCNNSYLTEKKEKKSLIVIWTQSSFYILQMKIWQKTALWWLMRVILWVQLLIYSGRIGEIFIQIIKIKLFLIICDTWNITKFRIVMI